LDSRTIGLLVIVLGVSGIVVGLLIMSGALGWFGRLPGDVRIERENLRIYVPIVSMLILSVAISIVLWLVRRL
jgi:hypothetical protein